MSYIVPPRPRIFLVLSFVSCSICFFEFDFSLPLCSSLRFFAVYTASAYCLLGGLLASCLSLFNTHIFYGKSHDTENLYKVGFPCMGIKSKSEHQNDTEDNCIFSWWLKRYFRVLKYPTVIFKCINYLSYYLKFLFFLSKKSNGKIN